IGEYDQHILAEPYGMLGELVPQHAFKVHPYRRGVIGDPENLNAATLDDVRHFHATYYRPDNATLVIVGDFESAQLDGWIDAYLAPIARPETPLPRVSVVEPAQTEERRLQHIAPSAPLPALQFAWHIGSAGDAEMPALDLIETLLGVGRSSRLYTSLVYTHQAATSAWAGADWTEQPGLFTIRATAAAGKSLAQIEALIDAEIERLANEPVRDDELEKIKTQLFASMVRERATYTDIAQMLIRSAMVRDSAHAVDDDWKRYAAVDAETLQAVAGRVFARGNRTAVEYVPGGAA
ncbi:MAG: insulinase family protein, partial [Candidatus Eremiobacteraeota bacterium]|nr:insulinase family protein [Candidatus Eremiobacteraeota bacterium]